MARLAVSLLGAMRVTVDGQPVTRFETEKVRALLAYLAAEADRPHRRDVLAEMLWPERGEGAANANLRHALARLRQAIGEGAQPAPGRRAASCLLVDRETIQLNCAGDAWVDAQAFTALLHGSPPEQGSAPAALEEAVALYRGPFWEDAPASDSAALEEWLLLTREQFRRLMLDALQRLTEGCAEAGDYERGLRHARRAAEIEPWDERAQRQVMRLLALTGRRSAALAQYEACRRVLAAELGVEPDPETVALSRRIRDGEPASLSPLLEPPAYMQDDAGEVAPPVFVARERHLAKLNALLDRALAGRGCVAFVTGGPGQGKTALLGEFARRAIAAHPDLLAAAGNCSDIAGAGDPYLPFRDVAAMLTGDVESRWSAGLVGREQARRLWGAQPMVIAALLACGSSLIGAFLPGEALFARAVRALPGRPDLAERLRALTARPRADPAGPEQSFLFAQYAGLLQAVAAGHPLLLLLDDLQWADNASISLLFHLARQLEGASHRMLIACAYRPEEVEPGRGGDRRPLEQVLHELKRIFGDTWVDLDATDAQEGRSFVDALLDSERNRLGAGFRAALYGRTEGHPLFTVELLRAMKERGELIPDVRADGAWIAGPALDWDRLPAQVEAVIQERIARLDPEMREILNAASIEGERFTAQVVAAVLGAAERSILRGLRRLEQRHRLVREAGEVQAGTRWMARYQFSHVLVREYLYRRLNQGERRLMHGQAATALAHLYAEQPGEAAFLLSHHFREAGDNGRALQYARLAAENAVRGYAHHEAIVLYTRAIDLAQQSAADAGALAELHRGRGRVHAISGDFGRGRADHEAALELSRAAGDRRGEWRGLIDLAELWTSRDYGQSRAFVDRALALAHEMGEAAALAGSLNWVGNWCTNAENPVEALGHHQQALAIFEQLGARAEVAHTLDRLGLTALIHGDLTAGVEYYQRAIAHYQELGDRAGLAASLTGRGLAGGGAYVAAASPAPRIPVDACRDLGQALQIAREIDSPAAEAWALWALGLVLAGQGRFGRALESVDGALALAGATGHREWLAGGRAILGGLYVELLAPEEAQPHLEQALALAQQLRSRHWMHYACSALAAAWRLRGDPARASACLRPAIADDPAMDTVHKRNCWIRRAELAIAQGDAGLASDIADRLIASAPGMAPGQVAPVLWLLKGEALAAGGQFEPARALLQAALDAAQAPGETFLRWRIHAGLGRACSALLSRPQAEQQFAAARASILDLARSVPDQALRDHFVQAACSMLASVS